MVNNENVIQMMNVEGKMKNLEGGTCIEDKIESVSIRGHDVRISDIRNPFVKRMVVEEYKRQSQGIDSSPPKDSYYRDTCSAIDITSKNCLK